MIRPIFSRWTLRSTPLTSETQLDFQRLIANTAHELGLKVGLKNDVDHVAVMAALYDFAVYEECEVYTAFLSKGKPVFNAEYEDHYIENRNGDRDALCAASRAQGLHTQVLSRDLDDSARHSCEWGR